MWIVDLYPAIYFAELRVERLVCRRLWSRRHGLSIAVEHRGHNHQHCALNKVRARLKVMQKPGQQGGEKNGEGGGVALENVVGVFDCSRHHEPAHRLQSHHAKHQRAVALEQSCNGLRIIIANPSSPKVLDILETTLQF